MDGGVTTSVEFEDAVRGLMNGDFSRLESLFDEPSVILKWQMEGRFSDQQVALAEAFTCACFNGKIHVAKALWSNHSIDFSMGNRTGLHAFHWAANRGQFEVVRFLISIKAPMEVKNSYGGTVLDCAVWSAIHEPKPDHLAIIRELIAAGADVRAVNRPTGRVDIDALFPPPFTPIDITDEEWIAAGQACGGLEIERLRSTRTNC